MIEEKVLYTDGHEVKVTDSTLQVRKHEYKLNGITKCGLMVIEPKRGPGIALLLIGVGLIISGVLKAFDPSAIPDMEIAGNFFSANTVAMWAGAALALIGVFVMGMVRERYALRIETAEGEKDAFVSRQKEYVTQVVDAINRSVGYIHSRATVGYFAEGDAAAYGQRTVL